MTVLMFSDASQLSLPVIGGHDFLAPAPSSLHCSVILVSLFCSSCFEFERFLFSLIGFLVFSVFFAANLTNSDGSFSFMISEFILLSFASC